MTKSTRGDEAGLMVPKTGQMFVGAVMDKPRLVNGQPYQNDFKLWKFRNCIGITVTLKCTFRSWKRHLQVSITRPINPSSDVYLFIIDPFIPEVLFPIAISID